MAEEGQETAPERLKLNPCHLHNTNFCALNTLLQKEILLRALYTHLIKKGERNREKRVSLIKLKNGCNEQSFIKSYFKPKRIIKNFGPYVVHFKRRDCPYVVHFKHRDCPYI